MNPATLVGPAVRKLTSATTGLKIPCISAKGLVFTAWVPSPEEVEDMVKGHPVWVVMRGPYIPELMVRVGEEKEVIPVDVKTRAIQEALPDDPHEEAVRRWKPTEQDRLYGRIMLALLALVLIYGGAALWRFLAR